MPKGPGKAVPEWSRKVIDFRQALKLTQGELGKRLKTSAMAVSRWERGETEPVGNRTFVSGIWRVTRCAGSFGHAQVLALRTLCASCRRQTDVCGRAGLPA